MAPLTRRRAAQNSSQEAQVAPPKSPVSKTKRKSAVEATEERSDSPEAESGTPKRQKLAVRVRDQVTTTKSKRNSNSEAPSTIKSKRSREALIADSAAEDSEDGEPTPRQVSKQLEEDATQQLKQELKAAAPKSKRIVFGDDNDVEKYVAAVARKAQKAQPAAPVDQEEDSDDDAPEAVSASAAVNESKRAAQALADATENQAATTKRRRQERDSTFKQQAEKRKRAVKPSKRVKVTEQGEDEADTPEAERVISGRRRAGKFDLPDVLPAEFLTDSEGEGEDDLGLLTMKRPRKITFDDAMQTLSKEGRAPKDEIVGSTAYRVMADQSDQKLTPRANHNSQNVKEMLLHRRRVGVPPNQGKSFFKRK